MKRKTKAVLLAALLTGVLCAGSFAYRRKDMAITRYTIDADIDAPVKIAHISDLHQDEERGKEILKALKEEKPDLILVTGDLINKEDGNAEWAESFLKECVQTAPTVMSLGNHETGYIYSTDRDLISRLRRSGAVILNDLSFGLQVNGQKIDLFGLTESLKNADESDAWENGWGDTVKARMDDWLEEPGYHILLSHYPSNVDCLQDTSIDLMLSGHNHGGQWRFRKQGVFSTTDGFFPKYSGGLYEEGGIQLIVSRGLGDHTVIVPRINNDPELVFIDLVPEKGDQDAG